MSGKLGDQGAGLGLGSGIVQTKEISITEAANAGLTTIATGTDQSVLIESIVLHADSAQTADMTSAAIEGGVAQIIEFISAAASVQANLDAENKQVSWIGAVFLPVGGQITIDLQGTGPTPLDLKVSIKYRAVADGGFLA